MMKIIIICFIALLILPFYNLRGQENTDALLYTFADKLPYFGNSDTDLYAYIYNHFEWPRNFDGDDRVLISFIVTKEGKVRKIKIENALCKECGEGIKDLFEEMPLWNPGEKDGKPVDVKLYLPIDITLK